LKSEQISQHGRAEILTANLSMQHIDINTDLSEYKNAQLSDLCVQLNLPKSGNKAALISRIQQYLKDNNSNQLNPHNNNDQINTNNSSGSESSQSKDTLRKRKSIICDDPNVDPATGEHRLKKYRYNVTQAITTRIQRALSQRLYLIAEKESNSDTERNYSVLGASGNVYNVRISHLLDCSCPDHRKGENSPISSERMEARHPQILTFRLAFLCF
jgi:hypothetical protein